MLYNCRTGRDKKVCCAVGSPTNLQIVLRIPVRVKDDTGISRCQVDAKSSGSGAQEEDKAVRIWRQTG